MGERLTQLSFEQWLTHVFDHPVDESRQEWYWDPEAAWWDGHHADTIRFLTRAFETSAQVFQPYSDTQLNQGLWYIASNACSNHIFALLDPHVPWPARQRCVRAMHPLFEDCFGRRCTSHLGHLDEPGANPLNSVCYMWWDILPLGPQPDDPDQRKLDQEILGVMESTLQLDAVPCQESALHGLGHWQQYYPQRVTGIIDAFLEHRAGLREELKIYAMSARRGCVL